jgi:hypothetical protein
LNPIPKLTHCKVCGKNWHDGLRSFISDQFELINSKSSLQFKICSLEYDLNRGYCALMILAWWVSLHHALTLAKLYTDLVLVRLNWHESSLHTNCKAT